MIITTASVSYTEDLEVSVATARLLLRLALRKEYATQGGEAPERARMRTPKERTGASLDLPAKTSVHEDAGAAHASETGAGLREIVTIRNARPDE